METSKKACNCIDCGFRAAVFENLIDSEIDIICLSKKEVGFNKGDVIVSKGQEVDEFLYLKSGLVKLFEPDAKGKEHIIRIAKPLDFVSLLSVFSETHYNFSITALNETVVCYIDLNSIKELIKSNGKFGLKLMEKMSNNFDKIIKANININSKQLRGRIAYILIFFADEIYNSSIFELPISRKEIAQLINMTTENVIRIFSEFRKDEIIKINGKVIEIINKEMLEKISKHG